MVDEIVDVLHSQVAAQRSVASPPSSRGAIDEKTLSGIDRKEIHGRA